MRDLPAERNPDQWSVERITARATPLRLRVVDREALLLNRVLEVDGRSVEVRNAHLVDDDLDSGEIDHRVAVQPGGCSGLIYQLYFDERLLDGDATRDFDGVEVVVDKMSVPYLLGASIDFEDTIQKQGFTIDNPNAQGSCACGDSFH